MSVHGTHGSVLCSEDTQRYCTLSLPDATHSIPQTAACPSDGRIWGYCGVLRAPRLRNRLALRARRIRLRFGTGLLFVLKPIGARVHAIAADLHRAPDPRVIF